MWFGFSLAQPSISNGHNSTCKTPQKLIRAPLESTRCQLSNGAQMSYWGVLHTEIWSHPVLRVKPKTRFDALPGVLVKIGGHHRNQRTRKPINPASHKFWWLPSACASNVRRNRRTVFDTCLCEMMTSPISYY